MELTGLKLSIKPEYEDELNGDVTKTGLSFMFIKDFTRFSDLFKNRKKKNEDNDKKQIIYISF